MTDRQSGLRYWNIAIGTFLFLALAIASANYAGLCLTRMKFLSNDELIERAFNYENRVIIRPDGRKSIPYASFAEYRRIYQECCRVRTDFIGDYVVTLWDHVVGNAATRVSVEYYRRWLASDGTIVVESSTNDPLHIVSNCGHVGKW